MSWPGSDERIHSVATHTPNKKPRKTEKKELPFPISLQCSRGSHGEATYLGKRLCQAHRNCTPTTPLSREPRHTIAVPVDSRTDTNEDPPKNAFYLASI